jgi:putative membrane protein
MVDMITIGLVFAALAALIHVYIFYLESIAWTSAKARATFGTTEETAEITRPLAFNQGFYNLFLVVWIVVGIVLYAAGQSACGAALVFVGAGSMVLAGVVLLASDRSKSRAALIQLVPPLIGVVALIVGLITR